MVNAQRPWVAISAGVQAESVLGVTAVVDGALRVGQVVGSADEVLGITARELEVHVLDLVIESSLGDGEVGDLGKFLGVGARGVVNDGRGADERGGGDGEDGGGLHFEIVCRDCLVVCLKCIGEDVVVVVDNDDDGKGYRRGETSSLMYRFHEASLAEAWEYVCMSILFPPFVRTCIVV